MAVTDPDLPEVRAANAVRRAQIREFNQAQFETGPTPTLSVEHDDLTYIVDKDTGTEFLARLNQLPGTGGGVGATGPTGPVGATGPSGAVGATGAAPATIDGGTASTVSTLIQERRGTAAQWASANPVLAAGEVGYETDTGVARVGDGTTAYLSLSAGVLISKQTAQVTNSSNVSTVDITGLAKPVQSGHLYDFHCLLTCQTDLATAGPVFSASIPSLTHGRWTAFVQVGATGTSHYSGQSAAFGGAAGYSSGTFSVGANTDFTVEIRGKFKPSADGTFQLRFRSSANGQVQTIKNEGLIRLIDLG